MVSGGVSGLDTEIPVWVVSTDVSKTGATAEVRREQLAQTNYVISLSLLASVMSSEDISLLMITHFLGKAH